MLRKRKVLTTLQHTITSCARPWKKNTRAHRIAVTLEFLLDLPAIGICKKVERYHEKQVEKAFTSGAVFKRIMDKVSGEASNSRPKSNNIRSVCCFVLRKGRVNFRPLCSGLHANTCGKMTVQCKDCKLVVLHLFYC